MDIAALLQVINDGGVIGLTVLIIICGARRWWVYAWAYKELVADRDYWRRMALAGGSLAEKAVDAAKGDG